MAKKATPSSSIPPDLLALLGAGSAKHPISVPDDYLAAYSSGQRDALGRQNVDFGGDYALNAGQTGIKPLYFQGDEYGQAPSAPDAIKALQQQLLTVGLLSASNLVYGQWDSRSAAGFSELLGIANAAGTDWQTALTARINARNAGDAVLAKRAPLVVHLANPDDIKVAVQNVAKSLYGGNLSDEDVARFVQSFQGQQTGAAQSAYAAGENPNTGFMDIDPTTGQPVQASGGVVTNAPSLSTAAESFIRTQHPDQVAVTAFGNAMNPILDTLRQSA